MPDLNLLIVGFNSVWEADHHFKTRISINSGALGFALDKIWNRSEVENSLKFAVWHHPLVSEEDRIKDHGFLVWPWQNLKFVFTAMSTRTMKAFSYIARVIESRRIHAVGAGTFGAPVRGWKPGYPLQYNLLRLSESTLRVKTRCRKKNQRRVGIRSSL